MTLNGASRREPGEFPLRPALRALSSCDQMTTAKPVLWSLAGAQRRIFGYGFRARTLPPATHSIERMDRSGPRASCGLSTYSKAKHRHPLTDTATIRMAFSRGGVTWRVRYGRPQGLMPGPSAAANTASARRLGTRI